MPAHTMVDNTMKQGELSQSELWKLSLAHLTAQQAVGDDEEPLVDKNTLVFFGKQRQPEGRRKGTRFERMFAIDRQVRKGQLKKHLFKAKLELLAESRPASQGGFIPEARDGCPRWKTQGLSNTFLATLSSKRSFFAVASSCEAATFCEQPFSVRACRKPCPWHEINEVDAYCLCSHFWDSL